MVQDDSNIELKNDGIPLTETQKAGIYNDYLSSLKGKIAEFIFIDNTVATELMQAYNELLAQIDMDNTLSLDMMKAINSLEHRVTQEKEKQLRQTSSNIPAFETKCIELMEGLNPDTIEQTQNEWNKLRQLLENGESTYTFEQRSQIQNLLSNLYFHIIKEKVRTNPSNVNLEKEVPQSQQAELKTSMYYQVIRLLNSDDSRKREIGQRIKTNMQLYTQTSEEMQVVYDKSIWEDFVQADGRGNIVKAPRTENNSLALVPQKQGIFQKLLGAIKGRNKLSFGKSEIERIADEVVTDKMLEQFIDYNMPPSQRYIPDKKLPVYLFLQQLKEVAREEIQTTTFTYQADNGIKYACEIMAVADKTNVFNSNNHAKKMYIRYKKGDQKLVRRSYPSQLDDNVILLIKFAEFLKCGTEFKQAVGDYYFYHEDAEFHKGNPYSLNIAKRFRKAMEEYEQQNFQFFTEEDEKRKQSKERRNQFLEELRVRNGNITGLPQSKETSRESPEGEIEKGD